MLLGLVGYISAILLVIAVLFAGAAKLFDGAARPDEAPLIAPSRNDSGPISTGSVVRSPHKNGATIRRLRKTGQSHATIASRYSSTKLSRHGRADRDRDDDM